MDETVKLVEPPCYFLGKPREGGGTDVYCDGDGIPVTRMLRAEIEFIKLVLGLDEYIVHTLTASGRVAPPLWSQRDPKWKDYHLGSGTTTIGSYGCLLTSIAMGLTALLGQEITPLEMNDRLNMVGGFTGENRNRLIWSKVPEAYRQVELVTLIHCTTTPAPTTQIDQWLKLGYVVVVRVDMKLATTEVDQHWVLLVSGNGTQGYGIHDPWPLPDDQREFAMPPAYCRMDVKPPWNAARAIFSVAVYRRKADAAG